MKELTAGVISLTTEEGRWTEVVSHTWSEGLGLEKAWVVLLRGLEKAWVVLLRGLEKAWVVLLKGLEKA